MPLTDVAVRAAKAGVKIVKLSDGEGLQLWVTPDGAKRWRLAYRFLGRQKTLAIGVYPETGLREARDAREAAKRLLKAKLDPSHHRKVERAANVKASADTFAAIAGELLAKKRREAKSESVDFRRDLTRDFH
jgi:Arm DNA-binding domain